MFTLILSTSCISQTYSLEEIYQKKSKRLLKQYCRQWAKEIEPYNPETFGDEALSPYNYETLEETPINPDNSKMCTADALTAIYEVYYAIQNPKNRKHIPKKLFYRKKYHLCQNVIVYAIDSFVGMSKSASQHVFFTYQNPTGEWSKYTIDFRPKPLNKRRTNLFLNKKYNREFIEFFNKRERDEALRCITFLNEVINIKTIYHGSLDIRDKPVIHAIVFNDTLTEAVATFSFMWSGSFGYNMGRVYLQKIDNVWIITKTRWLGHIDRI